MEVKDHLPAAAIDVDHQTIAAVGDSTFTCESIRYERDGSHPRGIIHLDIEKGCDVSLGHEQQMDRGSRNHILDGEQRLVLIGFDRWLAAGDNVTEDTSVIHTYAPC